MFAGQVAHGEWVEWTVGEGGNGHWYKLTSVVGAWEAAEAEAAAFGGHLVTIDNDAENEWIKGTFASASYPDHALWIGFKNFGTGHEGPWKWVEDPNLCYWTDGDGGSTCYVNWASGEPSSHSDENFGQMFTAGTTGDFGGWNNARNQYANDIYGIIESPKAVPAVSEWGLLAMVLLVLAAGTVAFRRMKQQPA